jgi:hypothetical protein
MNNNGGSGHLDFKLEIGRSKCITRNSVQTILNEEMSNDKIFPLWKERIDGDRIID